MTMTPESQQQEMEELVSGLAETMSLHFPQGPPNHDEKLVKHWLNELTAADNHVSDDMRNEILQLAMKQWKRRNPDTEQSSKSTIPSSFSLLDQLSSMPKRIFVHDIQVAPTPAERLQLLLHVSHVDDVASDWNTVLEMLYSGLTQGDYICDYVDLHRKWFDQCSSSLEYTLLEYGLASNLLKALRQFFATRAFVSNASSFKLAEELEVPYKMMQQWHVMWMTRMKQFRLDDANQMARDMMQLMRNFESTHEFSFLPAHFMALMDPYSEWFSQWIRHAVTPCDVLDNLFASGLFYDVMHRCQHEGNIISKSELISMSTTDAIMLKEGTDVQVSQLQRALWLQSLCSLRSILVCTRVVLFPWDQVSQEKSAQIPASTLLESLSVESSSFKLEIRKETPHKEAVQVIGCFLRMLQDENAATEIRDVCFEAIKTILCGMQDDTDFGEFEDMLKEYDIVESARKEFYKR